MITVRVMVGMMKKAKLMKVELIVSRIIQVVYVRYKEVPV